MATQHISAETILSEKSGSSNKVIVAKGIANSENTLNTMSGDITYEELLQIPGVSTLALNAKARSANISIFQKKDYVAPLANKTLQVSYYNIALLEKFISESGKIVPSRINNLPRAKQKMIKIAIKRARFLAFFAAVQY